MNHLKKFKSFNEDVYYPQDNEMSDVEKAKKAEQELTEYLTQFVDEQTGLDGMTYQVDVKNFPSIKIYVSDRTKRGKDASDDMKERMKADWRDMAEELCEELELHENMYNGFYVSVVNYKGFTIEKD